MNYKKIDMTTYKRINHFKHFLEMDNPFVEVTVEVDITDFYSKVKDNNYPFFLSLLYLIGKSANSINEFKQRILNNEIIEYPSCNSSYTLESLNGNYVYCLDDNSLPFNEYIKQTRLNEESARKKEVLTEEDELSKFFVSCLPWISFKQINNPYPNNHFSNPTFLIGKYFLRNEIITIDNEIKVIEKRYIPINVSVNHAIVDGKQIGEFFTTLEKNLKEFSIL